MRHLMRVVRQEPQRLSFPPAVTEGGISWGAIVEIVAVECATVLGCDELSGLWRERFADVEEPGGEIGAVEDGPALLVGF